MKGLLYALRPPFALFEPLFIVLSVLSLSLWNQIFGYTGGFMTGLSILAVLLR